MIVLGIDPGPVKSAYCVFDGTSILEKGHVYNPLLLGPFPERSIDDYVVGIEMIASYGMPVGAEVFETCVFIGQLTYYFEKWKGYQTHHIYRKDIKMHFCHSMKAKDANIRQALIDRFGAPGTKKNQGATYGVSGDVWSALAIAVYLYDNSIK